MKKLAFYGILTGLAIAGWTYLEYLLGFHTSPVGRYTGLVTFLWLLAGLLLGIRAYRDQENGGFIGYWGAVAAGLFLALFAGLIQGAFLYTYYSYIHPELVDFIVAADRREMEAHQATAAQVAAHSRQIREYYQVLPLVIRSFGGFMIGGAIFSLILATLLKKDHERP